MKEIMNKILLYGFTLGMLFLLDQYYIQPSMKVEKKIEEKVPEQPSKRDAHIPKLIAEKYDGK